MQGGNVIVFRTDANKAIGMGHYMRCFAIAHELVQRGFDVLFLIAPDADEAAVREQGFPLWQLKRQGGTIGWDADEAASWLSTQPVTVLFIDTYRIDFSSMKVLADAVLDTWYMDDLCAFDYPVAGIINYNLDASKAAYRLLLSKPVELFLGAAYYPVRHEILDARVRSLRSGVRRVLIATGATDPFRIAEVLLGELVQRFADVEFAVQLGKYYEDAYRAKLQVFAAEHANVRLLGWTRQMGTRYAACDVCITPGSSMMSEAMTVGVPCISFAFADNHLGQCIFMDQRKMAPYAGDARANLEAVCKRAGDVLASFRSLEERNFRRTRFAQLFDGKGASRVADALVRKQVMCARGGDTRPRDFIQVIGSRASAILYNFVLSNSITGMALMPANICECVPATYKKAGMDIVFCDIEFGTWQPDERQILELLESRPEIQLLHYNRTYGDSSDHSTFFRTLHAHFPRLVLVDDACLSMPPEKPLESLADLVLYSTGRAKPVSLGDGAFAYLKDGWKYEKHSLSGDASALDTEFDRSIKRCHAQHIPAEWEILLDDWMDPSRVPSADYLNSVREQRTHIQCHMDAIQQIYASLPNALPASMQGWRYNILVRNQEACMNALFEAGLFASHHYLSLGNGYFDDTETPNCDWLEQHVINLFEGDEYTPEMAKQTVRILRDVGEF